MRRVSTSELVPGMITAEDVYSFNNQLILSKGLILNDKTITKLAFYSVLQVRVEDQCIEPVVDESPYELSYSEKIQNSPEFIRFRTMWWNGALALIRTS